MPSEQQQPANCTTQTRTLKPSTLKCKANLVSERNHACAGEGGDIDNSLHAALLLRKPQRVGQRQPPLRVRVVHLRRQPAQVSTPTPSHIALIWGIK